MRKWLIGIAVSTVAIAIGIYVNVFAGWQLFDTTWAYDYAYVALPNGKVIEGEVDSWKDYSDGDQLQVVIEGVTYLTHASNVVLVYDGR